MHKLFKVLSAVLTTAVLAAAVIAVAAMPGVAGAGQGTGLPDLYFESAEFIPCSEAVKTSALSSHHFTEDNIINEAADGSYFDISAPPGEDGYYSEIYRTLCFKYKLGNEGDLKVDNMLEGDKVLYINTYFIDWVWNIYYDSSGWSPWILLEPEEFYESEGIATITLNTYANKPLCIGLEAQIKFLYGEATESDTKDNRTILCFDVDEYDFPGRPENFRVTKAGGVEFNFKWDEVEGADGYQVVAGDYTPGRDQVVFPVSMDGASADFVFPDDDYYCMDVTAVKNGVLGPRSDDICYSPANILFSDVPVDSWYFPYLQELQSNGIVNGYKDKDGNDLGIFGPADNLTLAETLKMGLTAFWSLRYTETESVDLPADLKDHWAQEYIQKAVSMKLSLFSHPDNLNPDRYITRGEMIGLLTEIDELAGVYTPPVVPLPGEKGQPYYFFPDIADSPYADAIQSAFENGYISGYDDGTFRPDTFLNRAEAVKILNKFR